MPNIKDELDDIKERNKRVESDKAWETSNFRRITIAVLTYIIAAIFLYTINITNYYYSALVPTGGYILSTWTLPPLKKWWIKKHQ